jgi:hypothetical protein
MYKIGAAIPVKYYHGTTGITINARIEDESGGLFGAELTLVENAAFKGAGHDGLYETTFTPDAAGTWAAIIYYAGVRVGATYYDVGGDLTAQEKLDVNAEVDNALDTAIPGAPTADSINERIETLDDNYTAARAAFLDELGAANLPADIDSLLARLTAARAGYLDELAAANLPADIDTLIARLTALRAGYLDELDFDLNARLGAPAGASMSADIADIEGKVDDLETRLTALRAGYLDELAAANLPTDVANVAAAIAALNDLSLADVEAECIDALESFVLDTLIDQAGPGVPTVDSFLDFIMNINVGQTFNRATDSLEAIGAAVAGGVGLSPTGSGVQQCVAFSIVNPLNNGITTICTVTNEPVVITSIVLHADTAAHADMTSCAIEGGVNQVVEFISAADAIEANLDAADKQVSWTGAVRLAVGKIVYIDLQGVGANAADLTVTITYHAEVATGVLA